MDINYSQNNSAMPDMPKKKGKKKMLIAILIFTVLIFIVNSLILADSIHTKAVTYKAIGGLVEGFSEGEKAEKQGNLGNFNVESKQNSISANKDGSHTLVLELEFTNYGKEGASFNEAVSVWAYQEDKEIKGGTLTYEFGEENAELNDEADIRVRNGKTAKVILRYIIKDASKDVNVDMSAGNNDFTYTVKLSEAPQQEAAAEEKDKTEESKKG